MNSGAQHENWRECYRQLAPKLVLFARQWVGSRADAEDVVQAAFVRFWRRQPLAQPEHYPLLYAAVRSAAIDQLRRDRRRAERETVHQLEVGSQLFEVPPQQQEEGAAIEAALQRLPEAQREVLVLRIWGELTFAEIATALGASINTITSRYRYGLETLRRVMKAHEYERV